MLWGRVGDWGCCSIRSEMAIGSTKLEKEDVKRAVWGIFDARVALLAPLKS